MKNPASFLSTASSLGVLDDRMRTAYEHALNKKKEPSEFDFVKPNVNTNLTLRMILLLKLYFELWIVRFKAPNQSVEDALYDAYQNQQLQEEFRLNYSAADFLAALLDEEADEKTRTIAEFLLNKFLFDLHIIGITFHHESTFAANLMAEFEAMQQANLAEIKSYIDTYISVKEEIQAYEFEIQERDQLQKILFGYYNDYEKAVGMEEITLELLYYEAEILNLKIKYKRERPNLGNDVIAELSKKKYQHKIMAKVARKNTLRLKELKFERDMELIRTGGGDTDLSTRHESERYLADLKRLYRKTHASLVKLTHPDKVRNMYVSENVKKALLSIYTLWDSKNKSLMADFSGVTTELLVNQIANNSYYFDRAKQLIEFNDADILESVSFLSSGKDLPSRKQSLESTIKKLEDDHVNITIEINHLQKTIEQDPKVQARKNPKVMESIKSDLLHKTAQLTLLVEKLGNEYIMVSLEAILRFATMQCSESVYSDVFTLLADVEKDMLLAHAEALIRKAIELATADGGRQEITTTDLVQAASFILGKEPGTMYQQLLN